MTSLTTKQEAVLLGPFVGELYWEFFRFTPMLPYMKSNEFKGRDIKYIVLTRRDRFDLYGKHANILVPMEIPGDYTNKKPECFRLINYSINDYKELAKKFNDKYSKKYKIIKHVYPNIEKPQFLNKGQFARRIMKFDYKPRQENYDLIQNYIPSNKPYIILGPRYRDGFKRNWGRWQEFYDILADSKLMNDFNFLICGKEGDYKPDNKNRFYDINNIKIGDRSSLVGLLMTAMEGAFFVCGSQSAIPNFGLMYKVDVLEFGCQRTLHTKSYNVHNSPVTFIDSKKYDIEPKILFKTLKKLVYEKRNK